MSRGLWAVQLNLDTSRGPKLGRLFLPEISFKAFTKKILGEGVRGAPTSRDYDSRAAYFERNKQFNVKEL